MHHWITRLMAGVVAAAPATLLAHPGHGTTPPETVQHYAFEPVHALPVLVVAAAIVVGMVARRSRRSR